MAAGLGLGATLPGLSAALDRLRVGTVSLPIAAGLLLMMYPVLARVRYEELRGSRADGVNDRAFFGVSLLLSWIAGPLLMFALAWLFLADQPEYRTGVIIVGLARCIAMVLIWNDLARGDRERAAVLVVFNALFQVFAYALLGYFYLTLLPGWLGLETQGFQPGIWEIARTVLIFLGIPLVAGFLTRRVALERRGRAWYEERFLPRIGPITLYGLLFTIVLLFAIQGERIVSQPFEVARIALPLLAYFAAMWTLGFACGRLLGFPYAQTASLAFTVASNDFELAIAVAVGVFGAASGQALAGVVGPLVEVPVLVGLVYLALRLSRRLPWPAPSAERSRVLFLCTHNSARSQMAEGLLRALGGGWFEAHSAGTEATRVRPLATRAMAEVGIDISRHQSKALDRYLGQRFDHVITVCDDANESCPIFPNARTRLHWSLPDPSRAAGTEAAQLAVYRAVRDDLRQRIERELLGGASGGRRRPPDGGVVRRV